MSDKPTRYCTITFMDGATMDFKFEALVEEGEPTMGSLVKEMNGLQNLVLKVDGTLTIIPMANVRTIELSPAPGSLQGMIIEARRR